MKDAANRSLEREKKDLCRECKRQKARDRMPGFQVKGSQFLKLYERSVQCQGCSVSRKRLKREVTIRSQPPQRSNCWHLVKRP